MRLFRDEINKVFTPRNSEVNPSMYIQRPELESSFRNALAGTLHILIHGESGCGKSWLYKKVLADESGFFEVANLANASRLGSITNEMANVVARRQHAHKVGYDEKKFTTVSAGVASGGIDHVNKYQIPQKDHLELCLEMARSEARGQRCCIVLDNLETIFGDEKLMRELGDIITLLDDKEYAKYGVKLIVVGIPAEVREYFEKTINRETVSNRLYEIAEVGRLNQGQVFELVRRGFCEELLVRFTEDMLAEFQKHIAWVTDGIPQRVHEYCLELAQLIQNNNWQPDLAQLDTADKNWLKSALSKNYTAVESLMNERETRAGRRNQVLYSLGRVTSDTFRYTDIEQIVRGEFPNSTNGITLDVPGVLAQLANNSTPPIRRTAKGDSYRFVDPKFRMCIRAMLAKADERVAKADFSHV